MSEQDLAKDYSGADKKPAYSSIELRGTTITVGGETITQLITDGPDNLRLGSCATLPADTSTGLSAGCLLLLIEEAGTSLYINTGDEDSCVLEAVALGAGAGDMLAATYDGAGKAEQVLTVGDLLDEDNFVSNSAVKAPSQQSAKAYIDAGDAATLAAAQVASEAYTDSLFGQSLDLVSYDPAGKGEQVLTVSDLLDEDDFVSNSAVKAPSQQSVAAYVATQIAGAGGVGFSADESLTLTASLLIKYTTGGADPAVGENITASDGATCTVAEVITIGADKFIRATVYDQSAGYFNTFNTLTGDIAFSGSGAGYAVRIANPPANTPVAIYEGITDHPQNPRLIGDRYIVGLDIFASLYYVPSRNEIWIGEADSNVLTTTLLSYWY